MALSGSLTPTNVLSTDQQTAVDGLLEKVFKFVIDFFYSLVTSIINFLTQPEVIGAIVTIAIVFLAWTMIRRRKMMP